MGLSVDIIQTKQFFISEAKKKLKPNIHIFYKKKCFTAAHGAKQFRKKYTMLEELGRGGFGIVYKAERNEDRAPVAVKFVEHKRVREWTMVNSEFQA